MAEWEPGQTITVVIPTRDRPADLARCLSSLTAVDYPKWEIVLADQGQTEFTAAVIGTWARHLPSLRHLPVAGTGASRARNAGVMAAQADVIAFLDDDCTVTSSWLQDTAQIFQRHPEAELIFGRVEAAPHDRTTHLIPIHEIHGERILKGRRDFLIGGGRGMAACMCLKRSLWNRIGVFDPDFGAGERLAGEERDYCYRALAAGASVVETSAISALHFGARPYHDGSAARLIRWGTYSEAALHIKILRRGDPAVVLLMAAETLRYLSRIRLGNLITHRGPTHLAWIAMYLYGIIAALGGPVLRHVTNRYARIS